MRRENQNPCRHSFSVTKLHYISLHYITSHYIILLQAVMSCPFMSDHEIDFYAYKLPIMVLLAANTFFLLWIMVVSGYNTIN